MFVLVIEDGEYGCHKENPELIFPAFILFLVDHIGIGYPGRSGQVGADHRKHRGINDDWRKVREYSHLLGMKISAASVQ